MKAAPTALFLSLAASGALAHMSIWTESMYGVGEGFDTSSGDPVAPLGPDWDSQDEWWFRGPTARSLSPAARGSNAVTQLPAGGSVTFEIACNVAWTSFGCCEWQVTNLPYGSNTLVAYYNATALDACPGNTGAYHSGDPAADTIDDSLLSGCALGIADVDDINDVTMDNLAIFSVNHECVKQKDTTFEIPAQMPACTGDKCICGWFWLANNGTANFYMTAFDCAVTGASANAPAIAAPVDPEYCPDDEFAAGTCSRPAGAKRPLYAYNEPTNVVWHGNDARPGYHASWGFPNNGAQNDIFVTANVTSSANATSSAVSATSSVVSSTAVSSSVAASSSSSASSSASSSSTSTTAAPTSTGLTPAQAAAAAWTSRSLASAASSSSKAAASSSKSAASAASAAAKSSSSAAAAFSRAAASAASSKSAASASSSKSAAKASSEAAKASSEASKSSSKAAAAASKAAAKVHAAEAAGAKNADRIKLAKLASATTSAPANAYTPHGGAAAAAAAWSSKIAASSSAKAASASASSRAAWRASAASKAAADRSSKREAASSRSAAVAAASSAAAAELDGAFKPNTQNLKLAVLGSIVNDDDE